MTTNDESTAIVPTDVADYTGEAPPETEAEARALVLPEGVQLEYASDHILLGNNFAVFSPETPLEEWQNFFETLQGRLEFAEKSLPWILGDAINFAEKHNLGEGRYTQFLDETTYSYGTLRNMAWVARRWAPKDRDISRAWSLYRQAAPLRYEAPALAAGIVANAVEQGHTRREVQDQVNAVSKRVRAEVKAAPNGQIDEPKIATQIHRPGCPTCTCTGAAVIGKPGRAPRAGAKVTPISAAPGSGRRRKTIEGTAQPVAAVAEKPARKGRAAPASTIAPAPKPIRQGRGRRGREANPLPVQITDVAVLDEDAPPLDGATFDAGDGGEFQVAFDPAEPEVDDRQLDPAHPDESF